MAIAAVALFYAPAVPCKLTLKDVVYIPIATRTCQCFLL